MFFTAVGIAGSVMAGGLVTNTNHSAYMVRMLSRQASTGVDAAYYNPAGLTKLSDGIHLSINNQVIGQTKTITNDYYFLKNSPREYTGTVSAPVFPGVYAVYKKNKFAFSAGFNPIGGGGGAEYLTGLPSFEMGIADLVPLLSDFGLPTDDYSADIYFKGSSIYFGYQANIAYAINDMISVAVGARFVSAKNTYEGEIKNIMANPTHPLLNPTGSLIPISAFFTTIGQPVYAAMTADREVEAAETGTGFTPILSVNISPVEKLNLSVKYEFQTKLTLTTEVTDNKGGGIFTDGEEVVADMPAQLSVGASFSPLEKLTLAAGMNYYFDKNNDYDGSADIDVVMIDKNFFEYSFGVEYALNSMIRVSAGYSGTQTGVNENYLSDLRYSLNTSTVGGGIGVSITPMIDVNVGGMYTMYQDGGKSITPVMPVPVITESYDTSTWVFGIGVDFHF